MEDLTTNKQVVRLLEMLYLKHVMISMEYYAQRTGREYKPITLSGEGIYICEREAQLDISIMF